MDKILIKKKITQAISVSAVVSIDLLRQLVRFLQWLEGHEKVIFGVPRFCKHGGELGASSGKRVRASL